MNWNLIPLVLLFLGVFFLISTSLIFYIRHWAYRHAGQVSLTPTEGTFFKRYIPQALREEYDKKVTGLKDHQRAKRRLRLAQFTSAIIVIGAIAVPAYWLIQNKDQLLTPIDLTDMEITKLDYTQHHWQRMVDKQLPSLPAILSQVKNKIFIIPFSEHDADWLVDGVNMRKYAFAHWVNFAQNQHFSIVQCEWKKLVTCQARHRHPFILVLPGYWDFAALDAALAHGANAIAYGPPAQLYKGNEDTTIAWHGLDFQKILKKEAGSIILRGDQLLTLGFDAGLILNAYSPFEGFKATTDSAQAISIGDTYRPGGVKETRLYAQTVGPGRLVWLDFAPDPINNPPELNITHLNALMAAIFRYLSRQSYSAIATWPQAREYAGLIEEDTEDRYLNAKKVIRLVQDRNYPISWFILSNVALRHRDLTRQLANTGEIACHGDNHGIFTKNTRREQVIRIARCQKVLHEITGIKPLAFRPPEEEYNSATIDAIANNGMTHYIANYTSDRPVPEIQESLTTKNSLVSIPRMVSDDYDLWHTRDLDHDDTIRMITRETDWMQYIGGLYMYSFHTQYMDKRDNLNAIQFLGNKLQESKAYFATAGNIAHWWRFRTNLQAGKPGSELEFNEFKPILLSVTEQGNLTREPYQPHSQP